MYEKNYSSWSYDLYDDGAYTVHAMPREQAPAPAIENDAPPLKRKINWRA